MRLTCCTDYWDEAADLAERWTLYVNKADCQRRNDTAIELLQSEANVLNANTLLRLSLVCLSSFSSLVLSHRKRTRLRCGKNSSSFYSGGQWFAYLVACSLLAALI